MAWFTLPVDGADVLGPFRTRYLRRSARLLLDWPEPLPPWLAHAWGGVREGLAALLARRPGDLYAALLLPQVGAPLHAGRLDLAVPAVLTELARRRALGEAVWWHGPVRQLPSPPAGVSWESPVERAGMLFHDGEVETSPGEIWAFTGPRRFHPLREGGWLAEVDNNPLASVEAHPDKAGNTLSLGEAPAEARVASLDDARRLIRLACPALADEHRALLATVGPVGGPMELSLSASYKEAIGLVYLSLHPSPLKLAEALVHEVQHNKLNLLSWSDTVLVEAGRTLHHSPVRPDPRPLWGVLLAAHAFLPVVEMFRGLARERHPLTQTDTFASRLAEVLEVNHEAMETLRAHARPTEIGGRLLAGMDALEREQWGTRSD